LSLPSENGINADACTQTLMHLLDDVSVDESVADVGLIGDNNHDVSVFLQQLDGSRCVWNEPEIIESSGSVGSAGAYQRLGTTRRHGLRKRLVAHHYHLVRFDAGRQFRNIVRW
jgi:hypothetical protein